MTAGGGGISLPEGMRLRRHRGRRRFLPGAPAPHAARPVEIAGSACRYLGIDPGTRATGYGLIERRGAGLAAVKYGVLRAPDGWPLDKRLLRIYEGLCGVLDGLKPDAVAVEQVFAGRAPRGGLVLGQGRGVALLAVAQRRLLLLELPPAEIKKSVTGRGQASKHQVCRMVISLLSLKSKPPALDAADALAAAWCLAMRAAWLAR